MTRPKQIRIVFRPEVKEQLKTDLGDALYDFFSKMSRGDPDFVEEWNPSLSFLCGDLTVYLGDCNIEITDWPKLLLKYLRDQDDGCFEDCSESFLAIAETLTKAAEYIKRRAKKKLS